MTKEQVQTMLASRISQLSFEEVKELKRLHIEQLESTSTLITDFVQWVQQYVLYQLEFLWHVTKEANT